MRIQERWNLPGSLSDVAKSMSFREYVLRANWLRRELRREAKEDARKQARLEGYLQQIAYVVAKSNAQTKQASNRIKFKDFEIEFKEKKKRTKEQSRLDMAKNLCSLFGMNPNKVLN